MSSNIKFASPVESFDPANNIGLTIFQASNVYTTVQNNSAGWGVGSGGVTTADINRWNSTSTTVQTNSATTWNYQGNDLKALSANWQNTFTNFSTQSSNNTSVFTTVRTNSATTWNYQGTDIKSLTSNWQNTFTNFSTQSSNNTSVFTTVNANSATWGGGSGGKIKQIVIAQTYDRVATTSFFPLDNTTPQNTEGAEISALNITLTPSNSANKIAIFVNLHISASQAVGFMACLFQNGNANAISMDWGVNNNAAWPYKLSWNTIVNAGSTSSRTYSVRFGQTSNTGHTLALNYYNGTYWNNILISSVVAIEYES